MHDTRIDPGVRERFQAMKGAEFAYTDIDPSRTAHLVVDMQNGFVAPGAALEVPEARNVVKNINRLSAAVRATGGVNCFFRFTTSTPDEWPVYFQQFQAPGFAAAEVAEFRSGTTGHAIYPLIDVQSEDLVLEKTRFSAFTPGASQALEVLRARHIDTVVISGTLTDCCCDATARDAHQLGFRVVFVADATAALTEAEHNAAITALAAWFADVRTTDETVALLSPVQVPASCSSDLDTGFEPMPHSLECDR